ncbi:MAG TPA: zf-HC2 domain-containing protein [Bryobacteraceae bacterium]|nr:zf-HC2 domain-containing protein [Bryobacteraceae bacterium]
MSCSSVDLKAYLLGELPPAERVSVHNHLHACPACSDEMERLDSMRTALASLADEEPPQRIAFVSDKVFEPRWWQTIWRSGPAMGFASAALLAAAIFVHAYARHAAPAVNTAEIEQRIEQQVNARIGAAVTQAVAAAEQRQDQRIAQAVTTAEQRFDAQYRSELANAHQMADYYRDQNARFMVASNNAARSSQ